MSNRWVSGSIAGIDLQDSGGRDCRTDVIDGEAFRSTFAGASVTALDLTVHTQIIERESKSVHFGVHIAQLPADTLGEIVDAINEAVGASADFVVTLADDAGIDDIDVLCVPDYEALGGKLYTRGAIAAGYVKDVLFRFISTGINP